MCLFLCANLNAQQLLQPTIDRSWRRSLDLCVWHADDADEISVSPRNRTGPARISDGPALANCPESVARPSVADYEWSCSEGDDSAEFWDQATKSFAQAWARVRRWLQRGL
jgi:hypothetical protein